MTELGEAPTPPHRMCTSLMVGGLADGKLHRVVLRDGADHQATELDPASLGDPFAQMLLARGVFPSTAGEVLARLQEEADAGHPLRTHRFFLVGEGGQVPELPGISLNRNLRFLVACGRGSNGADIIISSFHPEQGTVELIAWDTDSGGFNFYRTMPNTSAWMMAGNSRDALVAPTRGNGPFESHVNGHFLMKELAKPWVHWHSPFALISTSVLAAQGLDQHPWTSRLDPGGAYTLEDDIALPAIARWTRARVAAIQDGTSVETPRRMIEQIATTLTVNLISSRTTSVAAITGSVPTVGLPGSFFADAASLDAIGLSPPPRFEVNSAIYADTLRAIGSRIEDGTGFQQAGDTHFAFVVPERAHEDAETIRQAVEAGLLSRRLVACLLMVDFPNPVFSNLRATLLTHVKDEDFGQSDPSESIAQRIITSEAAQASGTAEAQFADLWSVGPDFEASFNSRLDAYYKAVTDRLTTSEGFADYTRVAEARRNSVRALPIFESPLLFATTDLPAATTVMRADGTVL